jgi:RNA polymerase sigma factor (sigma-70 family)
MLAETMVAEADGELRRERALVLAARAGDLAAYEQIVRSHQATALRVAASIGGSADADDIAQIAFVKAYRALHRFDVARPFRPWLLQIVANEARSARRLERRHRAIAERVEAHARPSHAETPGGSDLRTKLLQALAALSDRHRDVVTCRFLLELSEQETCEALGIRAGTAKSRLSRALDALRASLEAELAAAVDDEPYLRRSA